MVPVNVLPKHNNAAHAKRRANFVKLVDISSLVSPFAFYSDELKTVRAPVRSAVKIALASSRMFNEVE